MKSWGILLLALVAGGCAQEGKPLSAGGKPVRYWVEALRSPDARLRKQAAFKLGNVGSADPAAFPALLGALKDRNASVRCAVVLALLKFDERAEEILPSLAELKQKDRDASVRACAARALESLKRARDQGK